MHDNLNKLLKTFIFFFIFLNLAYSNQLSINENFLGDEKAENTLIEYASLSCVHCANFHNNELPIIKKELIDTYKLKYIYMDYPLDMQAMLGSMVAHCYQKEQYFEVLNSLYKRQKNWVPVSQSKEELNVAIYSVVKEHGISLDKVKSCTEDNAANKKKWDHILASRLNGQREGVNSTPSFFLNGKRINGKVNLAVIKKLIK